MKLLLIALTILRVKALKTLQEILRHDLSYINKTSIRVLRIFNGNMVTERC